MNKKFAGKILAVVLSVAIIFSIMPGMTFLAGAKDYVNTINFNDAQPFIYYHFTDVAVFGQEMVNKGVNGWIYMGFTRPKLVDNPNVYGDLSFSSTRINFGYEGVGADNFYDKYSGAMLGWSGFSDIYFVASNPGTYTFDAMICDEEGANIDVYYKINITIVPTNTPPTVAINTGVTVNEGSSVTISNTNLKANDMQTDDASLLTYRLTSVPSKGTLYNNGSSLSLNSTFTQADIDNSKITYTHDGSETTFDSFGFSVSDGTESVTDKTFAITVSPVNDAPVLTPKAPSITSIAADNTNNLGQTVDSFAGVSISDADSGAAKGIVITSTANGNGTWEYSINAGASWSSIGAVAENNALLLRNSDLVRFVPNGLDATTASITYKAWDRTLGTQGNKVNAVTSGGTTAFSTAEDTATITVTDVNDAPVLTAVNPSLSAITEDNMDSGQLISSFLANSISDADASALEGIAVSGLSGDGVWQYSTDGAVWNNIGSVSEASALLLNDSDRIRYVPDGENGETATITYKAWDRTSGTAGSKMNISICGGKTSISINSDTASKAVISVNDAPVLASNSLNFNQITEDDTLNAGQTVASIIGTSISDVDIGAINGIAVTSSAIGNGAWEYSIDNGAVWNSFGSVSGTNALLLRSTDKIRFVPNGIIGTNASINFRAWDQTAGTAGNKYDATTNGGTTSFSTAYNTASITVTDVNDVPTISYVSKLLNAKKNESYIIKFADLISDKADIDSNDIKFAIFDVSANGTLTKDGLPVTYFSSGESLIWTPNTYGTDVNAFLVKAFDGSAFSETAVPVIISVANEITPAVTANLATGSTVKKGANVILTSDNGSTIYYTVGVGVIPSDPNTSSSHITSGETISIDGNFGQTVTVKSYAVSNAGKDDSSIQTLTYTIQAKKTLTITGLSVKAKDYDGGVTATLEGTAVLNGDITLNDDVKISGTPSAVFLDKQVGTDKSVAIGGFELSGSDAQYYDLIQPSGLKGAINAKQINVGTVTVANKTYDRTTNATVSSITLNGVLDGDKVTANCTSSLFRSAGKGEQIVDITGISLTGDDSLNYLLGSTSATATATINAKELIPSATATDRIYNGNTDAIVSVNLAGIISPDIVSASFNANFRNADVGVNKIIDVTNIKLTGADFENYYLSADNVTATANITPKSTIITMNSASYTYDGSSRSLTASNTDNIDMKYTNNGQTDAGTYTVTAESNNPNYSGSATATLTINQAELTVAGLTASDKIYDGTNNAVLTGGILIGRVGNDDVAASMPTVGTFANKDAGSLITVIVPPISLSGNKSSNYKLTQPSGIKATITKKSLSIKAINNTITYGNIPASNGVTYDGFVNGETNSVLTGTLDYDYTYTTFGNIGNYVITPKGLQSSNYNITFEGGNLTVNAKPLTLNMSADNKTYDGTENATGLLSVTGMVNNDSIIVSGDFAFQNSSAGENKTVTASNIKLSGDKACNYTVETTKTANATIGKRALTIDGIVITDKTYDGSNNAMSNVTGANLKGIINSDDVTLDSNNMNALFSDASIGTSKTVTITGYALLGTKADNYSLSQPTGVTGNIISETQSQVTVSVSAENNYKGDWTNADVILTLTGSAPSTIEKYQYSTDGGTTWNDVTGSSITVNSTTNALYTFQSISKGNISSGTPAIFNVKIDKSVPVIGEDNGNPTSPINAEQVISFMVTDAESGIAAVSVTKGETSINVVKDENTGAYSFTTQGNGQYKIVASDNTGNSSDKIIDVTKLDFVKPIISSLIPANNELNVDTDNLTINFNESIKKANNNGDIIVYKADGTVFEKVDIKNNRVKISDNQLKIYFTKPFEANKTYYVTVAKDIILDLAGNAFDGISLKTDWVFKTKRVTVINSIIGIDVTVLNEKYPAVVDSADDTKYTVIAKPNSDNTVSAEISANFITSDASLYITTADTGVSINGNKIKITDINKNQAIINIQIRNSDGTIDTKIYTLVIQKGSLETLVKNEISNVSVNSNDLKGAVDITPEIDAGNKLQLILNVVNNENTITKEQKDEIASVLDNESVALYLDVSLVLNNITENKSTTVSNTQNPITIRIKLPNSMLGGSNYKVIRSHNGVVEIIDAELDGNYLTFKTDRFSQYAIAYTEPEKKPDPKKSSGEVIKVENTIEIGNHLPYIKGYSDNTFKPDNNITRAEVTTILSRLSGNYIENQYYANSFTDVKAESWYANVVGFSSQNGLMKGYEDGSFMPDGDMTRAEFAAVIARLKNLSISDNNKSAFSDISGHWAENYIMSLYSQGWINGYEDGRFMPDACITRAEAVKIINAAIGRTPNKDKINANLSIYNNTFSDITIAHWAYYDMLEATINHLITDFN